MRRRIFNTLAVISLLLFLATTTLWVWSYFAAVGVSRMGAMRADAVGVTRGWFGYGNHVMLSGSGNLLYNQGWKLYSTPPHNITFPTIAGFGYERRASAMEITLILVLPGWFVSAVTAVMPTFHMIVWRRQRLRKSRMREGACPTCGYDLRASPDRCPECGNVPQK